MSLFWIDTDKNLRVAIVLRPRGGDWLEGELQGMKHSGVDVLVSMLTPPEVEELGLTHEATISRQVGMEFGSFAIPDRETPDSYTSMRQFIEELTSELKMGKSVAVHCRASIGRSSLLLACLLCTTGLSPGAAFEAITKARGAKVPDTPEQIRWVERFADSLSATKSKFQLTQ